MRRAVYAGSFDPITLGHLWMIEQGCRLFDELIVAIGVNPEKHYLFPLADRLDMLRHVTSHCPNVKIASFENLFLVRYAHQVQADFILRGIRNEQDYQYERGMRYVNAELDANVQSVFLVPPRELVEVSSSFVKGLVGPNDWEPVLRRYVPEAVFHLFVQRFGHIDNSMPPEPPDAPSMDLAWNSDDASDLHKRWKRTWLGLGVSTDLIPQIAALIIAYQNADRHYHNLRHIADCLRELDTVRSLCQHPHAIEAAIWYHDIVYDPARPDNEQRSAEVATQDLRAAGVSPSVVDEICRLILATKHDAPPTDQDAQVLADIDLSILGKPWPIFKAYEHAISQEYKYLPDAAFRQGRADFLRRFLQRPSLFFTQAMQGRYESAARENIRRSIERLS